MELNTSDIYNKLNTYLMEKDYFSLDKDEKLKVIEESLINYTLLKINSMGLNEKLNQSNQQDFYLLLKIIDDGLILKEEKEEIFSPFTHCLLGILTAEQEILVTWNDATGSETITPIIEKGDMDIFNGEFIDYLATKKEDSPLEVINYVFNYLKSYLSADKEKEAGSQNSYTN